MKLDLLQINFHNVLYSENSSKKADEKSADAPKRINVSFRKKLFGRSSNRCVLLAGSNDLFFLS